MFGEFSKPSLLLEYTSTVLIFVDENMYHNDLLHTSVLKK